MSSTPDAENLLLDQFESPSSDTVLEITNEINQASSDNENLTDELNPVQAQNTLSASELVLQQKWCILLANCRIYGMLFQIMAKRGYRTASEYASQAAARIQINDSGFIDIVRFFFIL